jgi:hypothetical protein
MDLFSEAKHLHKQLEPIAKALDKLQSDSSSSKTKPTLTNQTQRHDVCFV